MPSPNRVHSNLNKTDLNFLLWFNLVVAFFGSLFLAAQKIDAGYIYTLLFVGIMACISLIHFFLSDDRSWKPITNYAKIPITTSLLVASLMYIIGMVVPFVLNFFFSLFNFSVTSFSIPLYSGELIGSQSFATAQISDSMAWKIFNIVFVAGNNETWVFNFGVMIIGILIGIGVLKLINDGKDLGFISKRTFVMLFGLGLSVITFVIMHTFNQSYTTTQFVVAGIFLLIANVSIYYGGAFLLFWAGYHQSNNLIWLIQNEGLAEVLKGFISPFGFIFIIYIALIVFYLMRNMDNIGRALSNYFSN